MGALWIAAALFFASTSPLWARVNFLSFDDISDKAISPQGKIALNLDGMNWFHAETRHFVYHFTSYKDEDVELYYTQAEVYYQWVKELFGVERDEWNKKSHVFVFTYDGLWKKFNARLQRTLEAQAFTSGWELFINRHPNGLNRLKTLSHELTHIIVFRFLEGTLPLALNEGFAEFVSYRAMAEKQGLDNSKIKIIKIINPRDYLQVDRLVAMEDYAADPKSVENFYIESEALVRFLVLKYGGPNFYTLLREIAKGQSFEQACERIYKLNPMELERKFKNYATQGVVS